MSTSCPRGFLLVLVAPSGAGKTTILDAILEQDSMIRRVITMTTRPPRDGEVDGISYHFRTSAEFADLVAADGMLEHATVFKKSYGIPRGTVVEAMEQGVDQIIITDWQGCRTLKEKLPGDVIGVYIAPPSLEELERRLIARGDDAQVVRQRMAEAASELSHRDDFDYVVLNDRLSDAVDAVRDIVSLERRQRATHQTPQASDDAFCSVTAVYS